MSKILWIDEEEDYETEERAFRKLEKERSRKTRTIEFRQRNSKVHVAEEEE